MLFQEAFWGQSPRRRIAVIGSGVAGLSAAWLLAQRHEVVLYEADSRPGGHANTVIAPTQNGAVAVDTGFIVYNERNYSNLTALFAHLGVATQESEMSFAASLDGGALEYSSVGLNGLLGQRRNLLRPRFWAMLRDLLRFYRTAPALLERDDLADVSLGDWLDANGYANSFIEDHLLPMGAAIWSTTAKDMRLFPVVAFVRFFASHGLLELVNRPRWRTVTGGSASYVERMVEPLGDGLRLGRAVASVRRGPVSVEVTDMRGERDVFTDVVLATHADQSLRMLGDANARERELLGAFSYTHNEAVLHTDAALMPKRRHVWASWNYVGEAALGDEAPLCVTYWMNRLQNLDPANPLFLTLNPTRTIADDKVLRRQDYTHPLFDRAALAAQPRLGEIQGVRNTWFCGSYFGHGFHEDALQSGLAVAEAIGAVRRPWRVDNENSRITVPPVRMLEAAE